MSGDLATSGKDTGIVGYNVQIAVDTQQGIRACASERPSKVIASGNFQFQPVQNDSPGGLCQAQ
jgi:hypothetical protein